MVTIQEGEALLIRGASKLTLSEGVRLERDDIVETTSGTGLLRVEYADGAIADLGPATRVLLAPSLPGERGRQPNRVYLQQGWLKLSTPAGAAAKNRPLGFSSPSFDLAAEGVVVAHRGDNGGFAFSESGEGRVVERRDGKAGASLGLKNGEAYQQEGDGKSRVSPRPAPSMLERMPRAFRDTLPPLAERYKGRDVPPKTLGSVAYADVQSWLQSEKSLRKSFVPRWKPLASQPEFRTGLITNMRLHPEWDRVLFPEKYLPPPHRASSSSARP
ncbi:hypothetical protein [Caldimonas brevitalea]|nr:hypothetical protein [Caldimonas brevitalea]